jgi:hypothetical protein
MDDFEVIEIPTSNAVKQPSSDLAGAQLEQTVKMNKKLNKSVFRLIDNEEDDTKEKKIDTVLRHVVSPILSSRAKQIIDYAAEEKDGKYKHVFVETDTSNDICEGREVAITQRSIDRSYTLFAEVMSKEQITSANLTTAVVYACSIVSNEYLTRWQDKQHLVLILLRQYVSNHDDDKQNQKQIHMLIDAHAPIVVEKVLCPNRKRFTIKYPKINCCKIL